MYHLKLLLLIILSIFSSCAETSAAESSKLSLNMSNSEITQRLNDIQSRFEQGKLHAQIWQYGWLAGFSASVAARTYIASADSDKNKRFDAGVGIFTSLSGLLSLTFKPLPSATATSKLNALPESTAEQRRSKLKYAEQLLRASANEVTRRRDWPIQGVFLLEQLLAGLAIGIIDDRPKDGLKTAALGMLASEIFTFTMPTRARADYNTYTKNTFEPKLARNSRQQYFFFPHVRGFRMIYLF